jgi:hypothetical protein
MQSTLTRKLYGSSAATTNDLAHIDIGYRCRLVGFLLAMGVVDAAAAAHDECIMQISVASVGSISVNDPQGVLAEMDLTTLLVTTGASNRQGNLAVSGLSIILPAGTRVYMHTYQVGTVATKCTAILYLEPF